VSREVWLIALVQLINRSGMMVLPFLTLYLTKDLDWSLSMAAIAGTSFGLGGLVSAMIGGFLVDRYPIFKIMLMSLFGGGLCFIVLTWINGFISFVIWIFITTTIADVLRPAAMGAITEFSNEKNLARGISLLRMAINLGFSIGPFIAGFLIVSIGYKFIFIVDGVTCILAGFLLYYFFKDKLSLHLNKSNTEIKSKLIEKSAPPFLDYTFMLFLFFNMIMLIMFFQLFYTIPLFFTEVYLLTEKDIGYFFMMNGFLIFLLEMPIIYYMEKKNLAYKPMVWGAFLIGISFLFLIFGTPQIWLTIILFNLIISIGEIINFPFISTISIIRAKEDNKGAYIGFMTTMFSIAFVLAPLVFMPFIETIGFKFVWIICFVVSIISAIALSLLKPSFEKTYKS